MATVIRTLTAHHVGGDTVDCYPTWQPQAFLGTMKLVAHAIRALLGASSSQIAHVHLSERGSFIREGSLLTLARRRGLVTVATIHGASFLSFARKHPRLVAAVLRQAQLVTCLDRETLDFVRSSVPTVRSELLPNPVVVDERYTRIDSTDELVLFAGEIGLRKGADVLHCAWQTVVQRRPAARCVMVGPLADFEPSPLERLEVRPPVDPQEMKELLLDARVLALPSRAEGMPMVLAEAMSVGRPFVSTPVGAIPELAAAGGMLAPVGDALALADRLIDLLADADRAQAMGESGRRFCLETRSIEVIDARLRGLYEEAAATQGRRMQPAAG